ncbi:MAG: sulfotransferase family 2 domain-containing protein [Thiobacillus sp.]|nr:sulfotransferase family 2 domain-containing protein [Thiobacillus sp.]
MLDIHDWPLLDKERLFDYLRWNSYRSERYKIIYVATPKVACTSIKWWFANLEGCAQALREDKTSSETDPDLIIHDTFHKVAPTVTGLEPDALGEAITSDAYFKFAVVRNPYQRIFSAWQSKLLLQEPLQVGPYLGLDFFNRPIGSMHEVALAFEGFLEHLVEREAPDYWDVHWTPQVTLLRPDLIKYTKLVKIENPQELSSALAKWIGPDFVDPFASRSANESLIPFLPELITARSAQLIHELYAEDFARFGYDGQTPASKECFSEDKFNFALKAISHIRARHQRMGEMAHQIASLNHAVSERDGQIVKVLQSELEASQSHITQASELEASRVQAVEFARQVKALQSELEASQSHIAHQAGEFVSLNAKRADELASARFLSKQLMRLVAEKIARAFTR